jgi:hydroxyethylthiazole kinase-like uncharacterized protein yjeF
MQTIVSAKEMRWCDETTIRKYGLPGLLLMENAGRGVADVALRQFGPLDGKNVLIFCGKGNNGGDGFVVARHLLTSRAIVTVVLLASAQQLEGDAKTNYQILDRLQRTGAHSLGIRLFSRAHLTKLPKPDLIIDAIFGTGFSGVVRQPYASAIEWVSKQGAPVLAVDIPSGVDGTTGVVANVAVKASHTVTFGLLKTGLLCNQGQDHVGKVHLIDIGIPEAVSSSKSLNTSLVEAIDIQRALPQRPSTANKYSVGKVFILAGSKGYTGAAYLCAMGALRAGAGAVMLGVPESVYPILARRLSEVIVKPLPSTSEGTVASGSLKFIREKTEWADTVILGPGLSTNAETQEVIRTIVSGYSGKAVVDADALRAVGALGLARLKRLKGRFILTPHAGEFSRLINLPAREIECKRMELVRKGATLSRATIVLKGGPTATGAADGRVYLNSTGNPGMATVGSGDVLTGIIASLWAQGMSEEAAAYSGVYLHGLSGDIAKEVYGERSVIAQDLIDQLPPAFKRIESV